MSQTKKSSYDLVKIYLPSKVLNKSNSNEKFYLSGAFKTKIGSINSFNSIYEIFINNFSNDSNKTANNIGTICFNKERQDEKFIKSEFYLCVLVQDKNFECKLFHKNKEITANIKFMIFIYKENQNLNINLLKKTESDSITQSKQINNKLSETESLNDAIIERTKK